MSNYLEGFPGVINKSIEINGNGNEKIEVEAKHRFLSVLNTTAYTVKIYASYENSNRNLLASIQAQQWATIPLLTRFREPNIKIYVEWTGAGAAVLPLLFCEENPYINVLLRV